jgi:lysozyme
LLTTDRKGDRISLSRGLQLLRNDVNKRAGAVNNLLGGAAVNQNQFDALMSFAYNLGTGALGQSTLLTKVKRNRNDPSIRNEFMRFVYAGGQKLPGLVRRRKAEADLYFS